MRINIMVPIFATCRFIKKLFAWRRQNIINKYSLGKKAAKFDPVGRTLKMAKYMAAIPDPPEAFDNIALVAARLGIKDINKLYPIDANDRLGCCVVAGAAHLITLCNGRIGELQIPTEAEVVKAYRRNSRCGKDEGLVMLDFLKWWRKNSIHDHRILAFGRVDFKNHKLVKQCIQLFGGVDLGFIVQQKAIEDFEKGITWQPGASDGKGHCVIGAAFDAETISLLTWGGLIKASWAWWDAQVDEAFAVLPLEAMEKGFAEGFDYPQLAADLAIISA
jgi:hypothetical protein